MVKLEDDVRDVVIIGGGPAGSTAAASLERAGHRVTMPEKEAFPREHAPGGEAS